MSESNSSSSAVAASDSNSNNPLAEYTEALPHAFGDFGGALSWTVPWSTGQQTTAWGAALRYLRTLDSFATAGLGVLDHLNGGQPLSSEALLDPAKALETLVRSPRGQALGLAVQTELNAIATDVSVNEHALAAIQLVLDVVSIQYPDRNIIADFDLAAVRNWGETASTVFNNLQNHLYRAGKCSVAMARLSAYALLARNASVYLIKDIPDSVRYGSAAWVNLAVAAATIEAETPGKVANMTFTQVMISAESAALVDPAVTGLVQTLALIDWGLVNGLLKEKEDDRRTDAELSAVKDEFNRQLSQRFDATVLLDSQIPSRKEIALVKLKEKFGSNVPFEELLFYRVAPEAADRAYAYLPGYSTDLHSLLDIAMEGGPPYDRWGTNDRRVKHFLPVINANLELGVADIFTTQFDATVRNLQKGTMYAVRHLISQLPLKDREHLEYGQIDFYQRKTYRKSTRFWGKDLIGANPELSLRVELNGEVTVYYINLKKGEIGRDHLHPGQATERDGQIPSIVHTTEPFMAVGSLPGTRLSSSPLPIPLSYSSERSREIAQAFVMHLDLNNENILKEARGQTTKDKQQAKFQAAVDFLLNLIPFKSAISSFIKGDYLDGAMDLFFDVLGFVTAGVGVASKLAQVASKTASALTKALRAARIIGTFVIGELNPLSALPALVGGGVRLVGKGLKSVGLRALEQINTLRNAPDGYKLLQTVSKEHGPTLLGTFKVGDQSIDGVGVLQNGNWYQYNHQTNQLYGSPGNFVPEPIGRGQIFGPSVNYPKFHEDFYNNLSNARAPKNHVAYQKGYRNGRLEQVNGYSPGVSLEKLYELASRSDLNPEQIGALTREIRSKMLDNGAYCSSLLLQDAQRVGAKVTPLSQNYYLANVDITSKGECAGLANAMAVAMHYEKENTLMQNFYKVANKSDNPQAEKFIKDLRQFQDKVNSTYTFHLKASPDVMSVDGIITELLSSRYSKSLRVTTKDHGMVAGIRVVDGKPLWFFYDPNSGLAKFETITAMKEGLHKVLESGALASTFNTHRNTKGGRVYEVSEFSLNDIDGSYIKRVEDLSSVELPDLPDELFSVQIIA